MRNFRYFFREGVGNMLSHGFMSFAAIGVTVACLLIMGTFSLVAYNANINLQDLQKENAVVAFVDESLTDEEAQGLQSQLSGISGVADCTFVSRQEARDEYVSPLPSPDALRKDAPAIPRRYLRNNLLSMFPPSPACPHVDGSRRFFPHYPLSSARMLFSFAEKYEAGCPCFSSRNYSEPHAQNRSFGTSPLRMQAFIKT